MIELERNQQAVIYQLEYLLGMASNKDMIKALKKAEREAIATRTTIRRLSKLDFGEV